MKKYLNGEYIDMTPEEIAEIESMPPPDPPVPSPEERLTALEEELLATKILLGGERMNMIELARRLRPIIVRAAQSLDDRTASEAPQLFDGLRGDGALIRAGTRINWHGTVMRAAQDLWDTPESTPETAPTLWEDIAYRDGVRLIPAVITPGLAFGLDELGWWGDTLPTSPSGGNVHTPEQAAELWEAQV